MPLVRARTLRWGVPVVAAAVVALTVGTVYNATASPSLPEKSAAELLVDLQQAIGNGQTAGTVKGMSGTVVQKSDLGLPELPTSGQGSAEMSSLLTGSHTLRVWYAGPQKVRLALLGSLGETDIVRNGTDLWRWSSQDNEARHSTLDKPTAANKVPEALPSGVPTPEAAARLALQAIEPTTQVSTNGTASVAGRDAYELVLAPKDKASLIGSVRLAVDAENGAPLRVRILPRGSNDPAFEVGFSKVSFSTPGDEQFKFTPPKGAKVTEEKDSPDKDKADAPHKGDVPTKPGAPQQDKPGTPAKPGTPPAAPDKGDTTVGEAWTTVMVARGAAADLSANKDFGSIVATLPRVSGDYGSGRLMESRLLSVLVLDDGRVLAGAVTPERLYEVARSTK
jgi:outer membrane lipoprotein-sorting protein